jgi:hypothetical protein
MPGVHHSSKSLTQRKQPGTPLAFSSNYNQANLELPPELAMQSHLARAAKRLSSVRLALCMLFLLINYYIRLPWHQAATRTISQPWLFPPHCRGLSDALLDSGAASSSGRQALQQQPWALAALRSQQAAASDGLQPTSQQGAQQSSSSGVAAQAEADAAAARALLPPGHTDFQQVGWLCLPSHALLTAL